MTCLEDCESTGTPRNYALPRNIALPYIYNWNSYDGLPVETTDELTWTSFPAGEPTAFLISAASKQEINHPLPLNGEPVPRPADINGNPVDIQIYSSKRTQSPFDVAVSLVPQNTGPTPHVHWSDYEWFYVLAGSITLYVDHLGVPDFAVPGTDGTPLLDHLYEVKVSAGQMVYGPSNMVHSFTNYSEEPAVWLTIWRRDQEEIPGGISQFFTRGDIAPLVLDYDASVDYYENSDFIERVTHWAETFPLYNVTIADNFGSYLSSGQFDPDHPNQPGDNHPNVIKEVPQAVLDENNSQELNSLFQGFSDLRVSLANNRKTLSVGSASRRDGLPINLEIDIHVPSDKAHRYGYFYVDNEKGDVNGLSWRSPLYALEAQKRVMPLFSLSSGVAGLSGVGSKTVAVETGKVLAFSQRDHKGNFVFSTVDPSAFEIVNSAGSFQPDPEKISINGRLKGAIAILDDTINGHNNIFRRPLLDARPLDRRDGDSIAQSMVTADSPSDYDVGYYKVVDQKGRIAAPNGNIVAPSHRKYPALALQAENLAADLNSSMNASLQSGEPVSGTLGAGELYAPFVQVKSDHAGGLETYFAFSAANPDQESRIAVLGTNAFGFRRSAEQSEYDSLIATNSFALTQQESSEGSAQDGEDEEGKRIEIQNYGFNRGALVFYHAGKSTGAVSGLEPRDEGYLEAALQWGKDHDTIIRYRDLPAMNASLDYADLGLRPERNYGMLYVKSSGVHGRSKSLSSYAAANPGGIQPFASYAGVDGLHSYGLETRVTSKSTLPDFADLYITSTVDNITIWS